MKTVLIIGATGATGREWLQLLLQFPETKKVKVLARSSASFQHEKLEWICADLLQDNAFESALEGVDTVLCSIGTTAKQTPDKEQYRAIDYGIPVRLAKAAHQKGIRSIGIISAMGADAQSRIFYNKLKGEMEQKVAATGIERTFLFRPSLISAERTQFRLGEKIADILMTALDFIIPLAYKRIKAQDLAKASLRFMKENAAPGVYIVPSDQLQRLKN